MTLSLETLNRGVVEVGFTFSDTSVVKLSEDLPSIGFDSFCRFAVDTLISARSSLTPSEVVVIRGMIKKRMEKMEELPDELSYERGFWGAVGRNFSEGLNEIDGYSAPPDYGSSPFTFRDGVVEVQGFYALPPVNFAYFTLYVLEGGNSGNGWKAKNLIPEIARTSIARLHEGFAIST